MHYNYEDIGYAVVLYSGDNSVLLQGDDAEGFLQEVNDLDTIWCEIGNPNPKIFDSYEDHLDLLIDPYFID